MNPNELLVEHNHFMNIKDLFHLDMEFHYFAGPCAVENIQQMEKIAAELVKNNVKFIRGGAFKPRSSPYDFQGLGLEGLKILDFIRRKYGLISVSEILDIRDIDQALDYIDIIQVGSRNMHNYALLKELGKSHHPVLLKRGMMATIKEFILAAEYIVMNGNDKLILCERGIRTFEDSTRNTLDIACIAIVKQETKLPIIADLSHSLGRTDIIAPLISAVKSAGADGVMLEVHDDPPQALSDSKQQINLCTFAGLLHR